MTTAPIRAIMTSSNSSSDGLHGDIVTFAMENNFGAVDAVLEPIRTNQCTARG